MRLRAATRRSSMVRTSDDVPRTEGLLPRYCNESTSKKDDDGHVRDQPRHKLSQAVLKSLFPWRHNKSYNLVNLCGGDVLYQLRQQLKVSIPYSMVTRTIFFFAIITWIQSQLRSTSSNGKHFPLLVSVEGVTMRQILSSSHTPLNFPILIQATGKHTSRFRHPKRLLARELDTGKHVDYGGLSIMFLEENQSRVIYHNYWLDEGEVHDRFARDDDVDNYYAFDDDHARDVTLTYEDDVVKQEGGYCRRVPWHKYTFHNCNTFHEMNTAVKVPEYLDHGAFREVFVHKNQFLGLEESIILKQSRFQLDYMYDQMEYVRMDALIMERLTSNDRIVTAYGHCANAVLTEFFVDGNLEDFALAGTGYYTEGNNTDNYGHEILPDNGLTLRQKLEISLELAQALSALHLFPGGRIVHNDLQPCQFLLTSAKGTIKLNDFNRAEPMLWDEEKQAPCRYSNGPGHGNLRSPEEYSDKLLDEKIDIYSLGLNMFLLLTGLWPDYDLADEETNAAFKLRTRLGEIPKIDPIYRNRSRAESDLVKLIEQCWAFDPKNRPDIETIIIRLRDALSHLREEEDK